MIKWRFQRLPTREAKETHHPDVIQCVVIGAKNAVGDEDISAFCAMLRSAMFDTAAIRRILPPHVLVGISALATDFRG
jgi:hypothetical protein